MTALANAVANLGRGDAKAALQDASAACHAAPGEPLAHYAYGQAWAALGEHGNAERAFGEAIRLAPGWAEAWVNYGVARYRQGNIQDAKTAMRQALRHAPGHPAATANLGAFMRLSGESEAGEALLRDVVARDPQATGARLNLAADLLQEGRHGEALALLDGTPPDERGAARHWHLQRALGLVELGRLPECRAALAAIAALGPVPPAVAPLWHWRCALLARAEGDVSRAHGAAAMMAAALGAMGPEGVPEHRIMGHYDLAKLYSGWGADDVAMHHWTEGHRLLAQTQPFSRADHQAAVDAQIAAFSAARLRDGPRASNRDPAPVFIVGMPRSGTTLCEQILGAHPQAHGAGERAALGDAAWVLGGRDAQCIAALGQVALDAAACSYLAALHALAPDRARIIDKMPGNYHQLGLVALLLPGARIIHCVRDPRDIGLSIFTFRFYGHHPYAHDLADLGWTIGEQRRLMAHWHAVLPEPILTVRLDDWVTDFDVTLARVLDHVGLPPDPACARFHERETRVRTVSRTQVREKVNGRGLGRWRRYAASLAPLLTELGQAGALEDWQEAKY